MDSFDYIFKYGTNSKYFFGRNTWLWERKTNIISQAVVDNKHKYEIYMTALLAASVFQIHLQLVNLDKIHIRWSLRIYQIHIPDGPCSSCQAKKQS